MTFFSNLLIPERAYLVSNPMLFVTMQVLFSRRKTCDHQSMKGDGGRRTILNRGIYSNKRVSYSRRSGMTVSMHWIVWQIALIDLSISFYNCKLLAYTSQTKSSHLDAEEVFTAMGRLGLRSDVSRLASVDRVVRPNLPAGLQSPPFQTADLTLQTSVLLEGWAGGRSYIEDLRKRWICVQCRLQNRSTWNSHVLRSYVIVGSSSTCVWICWDSK